MTTHTNTSVLATAGVNPVGVEFPELEVPILTGNQRQGDVYVLRVATVRQGRAIGSGVAVVAAEAGSANTHLLVGDGHWQEATGLGLVQGWVTVPQGGEAFLIHTDEHSALGIGPGTYEIRRQQEWTEHGWRQVAD